MPWWNTFGIGRRPEPPAADPVPAALTAAAAPVKKPQSQFLQHTQAWQSEAWDFYDASGEMNYAITWLANMMSQVRLRAARLSPELDEPEILNDGPAAEIVAALAGGVGGQSQIMRGLSSQLSVPGDCYLIGEQKGQAYTWSVRSTDEVRVQGTDFQVVSDRTPTIEWSNLPKDAIPIRVWRPHARWYHIADSPARSALPILRELDLVNRHITAQYLSRLASAGIVIFPEEVTFPVREEFEDANDPFMAEWIEIAAEAIRTPGTASAVIPIPIRVPAEFVDKVKHIDFTLKIDEKIIEKRESAVNRLATKLDIPTEVLTGIGRVNHWTAWQLDEGALKNHIAPLAELICHCLTVGYLAPRMEASGEKNLEEFVVWYDMSELAMRPDQSQNAKDAYDRMELSGEALRRESGFGEDDKPKPDELETIALKSIIRNFSGDAAAALDALLGKTVLQVAAAAPAATGTGSAPEQPPPGTGEDPPSVPKTQGAPPDAAAASDRILQQTKAVHAIRFSMTRPGELLHPPVCRTHAYSCPFTHAAWNIGVPALTTGTYECRLDAFGQLLIGRNAPELDTESWTVTQGFIATRKGQLNGRAKV